MVGRIKNYSKPVALVLTLVLISTLGVFNYGCGSSFHFPGAETETHSSNEPALQGLSGLVESGDLEPGVKTITANTEPATPDYIATLHVPSSENEIEVLKWFLELQIDEMSKDAYLTAKVSLNDYELQTVTGYPFYQIHSRGKVVIYGYLYASEQSTDNIFVESADNAYKVYLNTSSGSAKISSVKIYHAWRQDVWIASQIFNHQSVNEVDLLDTSKVITATSEPATPDFSSEVVACGTIAPDIFKVRQTVIGFKATVDSLSGTSPRLSYSLKFNGYTVATGSFTTASEHRDAATMVPEEVETKWSGQEKPNTAQLYLWVDGGEATISDLQMYYGVGNSMKSTDRLEDSCVMEIHVSGITSWVFNIKHRGAGTPEFRLAPIVYPHVPTLLEQGIVNSDSRFSINQTVIGSERGIYLWSSSGDERDVNMLEVVELDILSLK